MIYDRITEFWSIHQNIILLIVIKLCVSHSLPLGKKRDHRKQLKKQPRTPAKIIFLQPNRWRWQKLHAPFSSSQILHSSTFRAGEKNLWNSPGNRRTAAGNWISTFQRLCTRVCVFDNKIYYKFTGFFLSILLRGLMKFRRRLLPWAFRVGRNKRGYYASYA